MADDPNDKGQSDYDARITRWLWVTGVLILIMWILFS